MKEVRQSQREFHQALQEDRAKRVQAAGDYIKVAMEAGKVREDWTQISRWYRQVRGAQSPPSTKEIDNVTVERTELCRCRPPEGPKVPLLVRKADTEDSIPTEAELAEAIRGLTGDRVGALSGMQAEYLKGWMREAMRTKALARRRW